MSEPLEIVTIDGPSGVGKSTVSRMLAHELGFTYLDTGAMYRAVALACDRAGIELADETALAAFLDGLEISLSPASTPDSDVGICLNSEEVGHLIRTPEMGMRASLVSALPVVRRKLTSMQRDIGCRGRLVAEGRDTGTVVFPEAAWKFYLDADPEERARRRVRQLRQSGQAVDEAEILAQIIQRDQDDRNRSIAPLRVAADAVSIDATQLDAAGVVAIMLNHVVSTGSGMNNGL